MIYLDHEKGFETVKKQLIHSCFGAIVFLSLCCFCFTSALPVRAATRTNTASHALQSDSSITITKVYLQPDLVSRHETVKVFMNVHSDGNISSNSTEFGALFKAYNNFYTFPQKFGVRAGLTAGENVFWLYFTIPSEATIRSYYTLEGQLWQRTYNYSQKKWGEWRLMSIPTQKSSFYVSVRID